MSSTVSVGGNPCGVAVNPSTNSVYVANSSGNSVWFINASTNTVSSTVSVGGNPYGVAVNPSTNTVYVANDVDSSVSVINGSTNTVTATVSVGNSPIAVAVNPSTNTVYVANANSNSVSVINASTNTVTAAVSVGSYPNSVAVNPSTNTVYVANAGDNSVSVINGTTNTVSSTVSVGGNPYGVAVNPSTNTVYVANYFDKSVSVINGMTNTVSSTVSVGSYPIAVAVNPSTNTVYVTNRGDNSVSVINGTTNTVSSTLSVGSYPNAVAVNPSTNTVYVANASGNSLSVINASTNTVTATVSVGNSPIAVAVNPSTNTVDVTNAVDNLVSVIDASTSTVTTTVSVGSYPNSVAVNPSTNSVYVTNAGGNSVSVINGSILPSAPPVNASSASHGSVQISWSPPSIGANISFYCVSVAPRSGSAEVIYVPASQLNTTITGLTNGITYSVTVTAVSSLGAGSPSSPATLTPTAVPPGAPVIFSSQAGNSSGLVRWTVPSAGDAPILSYAFTVYSPLGQAIISTSVPASQAHATITGLANDITYSVTVAAVSGFGAGPSSSPVSLTPTAVLPGAPAITASSVGNGSASVRWTVPSAGDAPILFYKLITSQGSSSTTTLYDASVNSATVSGLANGITYSVTVAAVSGFGAGPSSSPVSLTPTAVLPGAPAITASSVGNGSASVRWTVPSAGDAPILFYKLITSQGSSSTTTLYDASVNSATVSGLANGITYSVTVAAVSGLGMGTASTTASLTPQTVPTAPGSPKTTAGTKKVTLSWSVPSSNGGSPVTGYRVYIGTSAGHESSTPMNANLVTSLSYIASSLTKGKKYYFVIKAVNAAGMSLGSVEVSATAK